jgi:replicative DNA helicase
MTEPTPEDLAAVRNESDYDADPFSNGKGQSNGLPVKRRTYTPENQRLLPQSVDAEKGLLSSLLIAPRDILGLCVEKGLKPDWFQMPNHALIYEAVVSLHTAGKPVDFISVTAHLRDCRELENAGGAVYVTELFTFLPTAANAAYYIDLLAEKAIARAIIRTCAEFGSKAYDSDAIHEIQNQFEAAVLAINRTAEAKAITFARDILPEAEAEFIDRLNRPGSIAGLSTGFRGLDLMTDGLCPCEVTVIAARTSNGKTALAANIAEHIAVTLQKPVLVFSVEMNGKQFLQRMALSLGRLNAEKIRAGTFSQSDIDRYRRAVDTLTAAPLIVEHQYRLTVQELQARARRIHDKHGVAAIIVDYVQLLESDTKRAQHGDEARISEASAGIKHLSLELRVPVIEIAQLNRTPDKRESGRPAISDLRGSGSLEQDADKILLIHRPELYAIGEERDDLLGVADLIVGKNRSGSTGEVPLTFLREFCRFESRAMEVEEQPGLNI